jgi:phosphomannomutase/phosphoglucomutase
MVSTYIDEVVSDIAIAVPLKVVVDAGNGATGHIAPALLEELGCEVIPLNCEVDGSFPNRSPDTGDEAALAGLVEAVKAEQADFGVAYDGDGDRLAVVTGSGRILRTDVLMMLFARDVVARHPGADVVYDVKCSRDLAQLITSLGGRPVLWKTGHALMKQKMAETGALLGGEFSGHIFFGERWYGFDDGMYATGRLAEILSSQELSLDDFIADLPAAVSTPEILIEVPDDEKFELIDRFCREASFPNGKSNDLDGLRVDFPEGWGLLRASNTGPALTARFEGRDEATLKEIQNRFREELGRVAPDLDIPF